GERRWTAIDALVAALGGAGLALLVNRLNALLMAHFHAEALLNIGPPALIATAAPALAALAGAATRLPVLAAMLVLLLLVLRNLRPSLQAPLILLGLLGLASQQVRTPAELALQYAMVLTGAAAAALFCWWFGRRNYLAY